MKLLEPGETPDGFVVKANLHSGAWRTSIKFNMPTARPIRFRMAMKVPRMATGDGAENIVGFEVEAQILQALSGLHVPRFVAAGDLTRVPLSGDGVHRGPAVAALARRCSRDAHPAGCGDHRPPGRSGRQCRPQPASAERGASGPEAGQRDDSPR